MLCLAVSVSACFRLLATCRDSPDTHLVSCTHVNCMHQAVIFAGSCVLKRVVHTQYIHSQSDCTNTKVFIYILRIHMSCTCTGFGRNGARGAACAKKLYFLHERYSHVGT